ncbi:MAG TPA: hypothetical protein VF658_00485 [Pyrinomonadaceae bacterium]
MPRPHTARSICIGIARAGVTAMLALVLLSGLIPSGALSASHTCKTACCAGKPPHEAGACSAFPTSAEKDEPQQEASAVSIGHSSGHDEMQMSGTDTETATETFIETNASSGHCQAAEHSSAERRSPRRASSKPSSVAAQAFTRPCAAECAVAALSLSQARRPREAATFSIAVRPRAPTLLSRADSNNNLSISSTERRQRIRPRAPPVMLDNLSA